MVKKRKKKSSKKRIKSKVICTHRKPITEGKVRKDFYKFQGKVDRLEEIKNELRVLESEGIDKGFEKEISLIRSRLKDTSAIPEIKKQIESLRRKIKDRKVIKRKSSVAKIKQNVEDVAENVGKIKDSNAQLKGEIKVLREELEKKFKLPGKVDSSVDLVVDEGFHIFIDNIKKGISEEFRKKEKEMYHKVRGDLELKKRELDVKYKDMMQGMKKHYDAKEDKLNKFYLERKDKLKKHYTADENELVLKEQGMKQKYTADENELVLKEQELKKSADKSLGQKREIQELHKKLYNKTAELGDRILKANKLVEIQKQQLQKQKQKIHELIRKQKQDNISFIVERTKIRHQVAIRVSQEHKKIIEHHKESLSNAVAKLKKQMNINFENQLRQAIKEQQRKFYSQFQSEKTSLKKKLSSLSFKQKRELKFKLKTEYINKLKTAIELQKEIIQERLKKEFGSQVASRLLVEKKKIENKLKQFESEYEHHEVELKSKERTLIESEKAKSLEVALEKRRLVDKLNLFKDEESMKLKQDRIKLQKEIAEKMHIQMVNELKKRAEILRADMRKKFEVKLKEYHKIQEQELARKKAELAQELQKRAAAILS